jgi:hypothetical protein
MITASSNVGSHGYPRQSGATGTSCFAAQSHGCAARYRYIWIGVDAIQLGAIMMQVAIRNDKPMKNL